MNRTCTLQFILPFPPSYGLILFPLKSQEGGKRELQWMLKYYTLPVLGLFFFFCEACLQSLQMCVKKND